MARLVPEAARDPWTGSAAPGAVPPAGPGARIVPRRVAPTPEVPMPVVLDLLDAACGAGVSLTRALDVVGRAVGGSRGAALVGAAAVLGLGGGWDEAWAGAPEPLDPVVHALRGAWEQGLAPAGALRVAAANLRLQSHAEAMESAGRLGVRLVLPLGLCFLPAFVLVGLVPVLLAMAGSTLGP